MQPDNWPTLCETLLERLEALGENVSLERAEFGVLMVGCGFKDCPLIKNSKEMIV